VNAQGENCMTSGLASRASC